MQTVKCGPAEFGRTVSKWLKDYDRGTVLDRVHEALDNSNIIDAQKMPLGGLAYGMMGDDWTRRLGRFVQSGGMSQYGRVMESTEALDASAFSNITGQLLIRLLQEGYQSPAFIASNLVTIVPEGMTDAILGELKVPDISGVPDGPSRVQPGMPYPQVGVKEDWVTLPAIEKFGYRLPIFLETLAQDRTGRIQESAKKLGVRLGIDREERIFRPILGLVNTFKWQDTTYTTYLTSGGWINKKTGVSVTGATWELFNAQNQLFVKMLDPFTSKPITIDYNRMQILTMPESVGSFNVAMNAVTINVGQISTAPGTQHVGAPNLFKYPVWASPYARNLLSVEGGISDANLAHYWYQGDFKSGFVYREWIPQEAFVAPPLNDAEFNQDVVMHIKCREAGRAGVMNPRYSSMSINS